MKEKYDVHAIMEELKRKEEMDADLHDGCYQLMRETIESYARLTDYSILDYKDLDLIYLTTVGTWKHNIEAKKRKIEESHLREEDKQSLSDLWDEVKQKTIEGAYGNRIDGKATIGLFGTGLFTFVTKATNNNNIQEFIHMCVDILPMNDDASIYERASLVLGQPFKGMGAAAVSMILHCLKPCTFPVLNATMGKPNIFEVLGVKLIEPKQSETYIENCKSITEFRNNNFPYKNYRIFDLEALNVDEHIVSKKAWLIAWNSDNYQWGNYADICEKTKSGGTYVESWSFANTQVQVGEEVYLIKLGTYPKGIIAHGVVEKGIYEKEHYNSQKAAEGKTEKCIDVRFDRILNYEKESILTQDELITKCQMQHWSPQQSGIEIVPEAVPIVNKLWNDILNKGIDNMSEYLFENNMREAIEKFINEYEVAKGETFAQHPLGTFVRTEIPQVIYSTGIVDSNKYLITASVGQGNWATVPWICIFDRAITTTATKGVYIVYLLSKDTNTLYLTFNQGCTEIRRANTKRKTIEIMREKATKIINEIDSRGFRTDEEINLGQGLTELAELYQKGTIFYKAYTKGKVPEESELRKDLQNMIDIYKEYVNPEIIIEPGPGGGEEVTTKETIQNIKNYIAAKGFSYEDGLIENFYLGLKSKPFVILAGTSGTGKTRLVKLFAEAIGATNENGRYKMVSVRPDWSDSTDLFGHVDLNGHFIPGAIIDFVKNAQQDIDHPYILCLDEMNLARVEYYLSDFLSVVETRDFDEQGRIETDPLVPENYYGSDDTAKKDFGKLTLPENLYVVGTVNMDETTFPFSKKVLDRANTIEFSKVDLEPQFGEEQNAPKLNLSNQFLKTKYLLLKQCKEEAEAVRQYCEELIKINDKLKDADAHIGYRIRDEIVFYLLNNKEESLIPENDAFDNEILQKILPRIQGSSTSIKNMLCELFKLCAGDYEGIQTETDISAKMLKKAENPDCRYKKSAKKIAFMVRRYEEDGFTSYWL